MEGKRLYYAEGVLLLVAFFWGINPPIMKVGLPYLDPMSYNALRMMLATAVSVAVLRITGACRPLAAEDRKKIILVSIAGFFVFQLFFTVGVEKTTAGNASLLLGLLPVSVAFLNTVFKLEKISLPLFSGIVLTLAGVALIVLGSGKEFSLANNHLIGAAMLLAAQTGYGYYTIFSKELTQKYSTYQITTYVMALTTALFTAISLPRMAVMDWSAVPPVAWISILYSGVFALCLSNFLWIWGIGKLGSTKASLYNNISPLFAIAAGCLFLDEIFGWLQFAGAVLIFLGLYVTRTKGEFLTRFAKRLSKYN
ncbi:MAG: DMT family transporter [Negativicutes bacterium]|nr:DMT family transporter [Negativicutes bacterium]